MVPDLTQQCRKLKVHIPSKHHQEEHEYFLDRSHLRRKPPKSIYFLMSVYRRLNCFLIFSHSYTLKLVFLRIISQNIHSPPLRLRCYQFLEQLSAASDLVARGVIEHTLGKEYGLPIIYYYSNMFSIRILKMKLR